MAELSQATAGGTGIPGSAAAGGTAGAPGEPTAGSPEVLIIVCAGVVLASLDLFIVNVALPAIAHDLGTHSLGELSWVLNGYAIVYASLLVLAGKLADRHRCSPRTRRSGAAGRSGPGPPPAVWRPPSDR